MVARLREMPEEDFMLFSKRPFVIRVGEEAIMVVSDQIQASTIVNLLNEAKDFSKHNAMNILVRQLHFGEDRAQQLWLDLKASDSMHPASYTVN